MFLSVPTGLIWSMRKLECSLNTILIYMKSTMGRVTLFFCLFCVSCWVFFFLCVWAFLAILFLKGKKIFSGSSATSIDNSVSQGIKNSGKIFITKNLVFSDKTVETTLMATKFENGNDKNTTNIWPGNGYFKQQPCDFGIDKEKFPENSIIYINQCFLTIKDNKKLYYLISRINECVNPP